MIYRFFCRVCRYGIYSNRNSVRCPKCGGTNLRKDLINKTSSRCCGKH